MMRIYKGRLQKLLFSLFVPSWLLHLSNAAPFTTSTDPYIILGVNREDSDSLIRKQYHKLCLRYHPDKQVHKSQREKKQLEEGFKRIQAAYAQINTAENRRQYDATTSMQNLFGNHAPSSSSTDFSDILREFQRQSFSTENQKPFGRVFSTNSERNSIFPQFSSFGKSIFQESVSVPLATLYKGLDGDSSLYHSIKVNLWRRVVAAFRGGIAYPILYTSLLYALPLLRVFGKHGTFLMWLSIFISQLPQPVTTRVRVPIRAGYKPGTKLTFQKEAMAEIVLVLKGEEHAYYEMIGNNLHTTAILSLKQARKGCTLRRTRLGSDTADVLYITIPAGSCEGDTVRVRGEGWPIRKARDRYGDLIVHVRIRKHRT
jgi:DnaJ-class molecular chaperone